MREMLNAVNIIAKLSMTFYRATLNAGADKNEAWDLTRAYLASFNTPTNNSSSLESEE